MPQKLVIDPDMPLRARDVVALGLDGNKLGFALPSASRRQRITEALEASARTATPTPGSASCPAASSSAC